MSLDDHCRDCAARRGIQNRGLPLSQQRLYQSGEKGEDPGRHRGDRYIPSRRRRTCAAAPAGDRRDLPKIDSESISRIVAGISQVLEEKGFQLLLANTENNIEREISYLEYFKNDQVDGILFIATILTRRHKEAIVGSRVPIVMIGQKADYVSCVYHDDFAAARELTELLVRTGRRQIGMLSVTQRDLAAGAARLQGLPKRCGNMACKPCPSVSSARILR